MADSSRSNKRTRTQLVQRKKRIEELIKSAYSSSSYKDQFFSQFLFFQRFSNPGLSIFLESGRGNKLSSSLKQYIQKLLKVNMEGPFGAEWPEEEKVKRREMSSPEALYIFVKVPSTSDNAKASIIGFVHYRFTIEEGIPVLYLYELQLEPAYQGKGIGKILMELIELIAFKNGMGAVVLTVQKQNTLAVNFYLNTLSYSISAISPSKVVQLMGVIGEEKSYEILCKTFDHEHEAKAVLERDLQTGQFSNLTEKFCDNQDYVNQIAQSEQQQMEALRDSQSGTATPKSDDAILSQVLGETREHNRVQRKKLLGSSSFQSQQPKMFTQHQVNKLFAPLNKLIEFQNSQMSSIYNALVAAKIPVPVFQPIKPIDIANIEEDDEEDEDEDEVDS